MTPTHVPRFVVAALAGITLLSGCAQDARTDSLENRQSRMDSRTEARTERRQIRSDREDARVKARMDAW